MSVFTDAERDFLQESRLLGRLATMTAGGSPDVVPVGWRYNADLDAIDVGGRDPEEFVGTRKFHHVQNSGRVGFVIDEVLPPWRPRCITLRGSATAIDERDEDGHRTALIRITPQKVT